MRSKNPQSNNNIIDLINSIDFNSDRLNLKKFSISELEYNIEHEMNPTIMQYIRTPLPLGEVRKKTLQAVAKWSGYESDWVLLGLRLNHSNEYIGMLCFRYESIENDTVEIGWRLGLEHHGKGYATEAAQCFLTFLKNKIKPHKVVAYCLAKNIASAKIMHKLGMQQEACLRQAFKINNQWHDELVYGLILE
jgi:RimJ/RimL family protein N-acetyltransferase